MKDDFDRFKVGDRVGICDPVLLGQLAAWNSPHPTFGHVVNVRGQSLVWELSDHGS